MVGRSVVRGLLAGVLVVTLAAGCASGSGDERLPPADDPVAWAGRLCASLQPVSTLSGYRPTVDPNNPGASREALSAYFAETERRAEQALTGLDYAGPSPIAGGDEVVTKLRAALQRLRASYAEAKRQVDAINPHDPVALGSRLPEIFAALPTTATDKDLAAVRDNQAVNEAVKRSPSCAIFPAAGASSPN